MSIGPGVIDDCGDMSEEEYFRGMVAAQEVRPMNPAAIAHRALLTVQVEMLMTNLAPISDYPMVELGRLYDALTSGQMDDLIEAHTSKLPDVFRRNRDV